MTSSFASSVEIDVAPSPLVTLPGGSFLMGSERFYPEERPVRRADVAPFRIERTPVTEAQFAAFATSTGYLTQAETEGGSMVFMRHERPAVAPCWLWVEGASWRSPGGPRSMQTPPGARPVVHVGAEDAEAYAAWADRRLPTEKEWEFAARGGLNGTDYAWGDNRMPPGPASANIWCGEFPIQRDDGREFPYTSAVGAYPKNGFGLFDMIGNVWEITSDLFDAAFSDACCSTPAQGRATNLRVLKGGSHLCADNACQRYRPAARQPMSTPTSHIGFRCARSL